MALALLLAGAPQSAHADIALHLHPDKVAVAQPVTLTLKSDGQAVTWPDWEAALPGWEIVVQQADEQAATLTLRSYLPGDLAVPAITVSTPGGVSFVTDPRTVTVQSVLPEGADVTDAALLKPEAGALPAASVPGLRGIATLIAAAAAATAGVLLLIGWRRRSARRAAPAAQVDQALRAAQEHHDPAQAVWAVRRAAELASGQRFSTHTAADLAADHGARALLSADVYDTFVAFLRDAEAARHSPSSVDQHTQVVQAAHALVHDIRAWAASRRHTDMGAA